MRKYGASAQVIGWFDVAKSKEVLRYQYLPIKLISGTEIVVEPSLAAPFSKIIGAACCDFIGLKGLDAFVDTNVYFTAKRRYQTPETPLTRPGWHCDGFMTDDINYIWSDCQSTLFNHSAFVLTQDDELSIIEMGQQADPEMNAGYADNALLRMDQFVVHRAGDVTMKGVRTFVKVSFSRDKYDLEGNSVNSLLNYNWTYRPRLNRRNVPQEIK